MPKLPVVIPQSISSRYAVANETLTAIENSDPSRLLEVEVGDIKQADFLPQFKAKVWNNEVNLSVRLVDSDYAAATVRLAGDKIEWTRGDRTARFYSKTKEEVTPVVGTSVRLIDRGTVTPDEFTAEYELYRSVSSPLATIAEMDRPALLFYGTQHADSYYDLKTLELPIYRFYTKHNGNPMYTESGIKWCLYHYVNERSDITPLIENLFQATEEALAPYNVQTVRRGKKMMFVLDGKEYKFLSAAGEHNSLGFYLNLSGNYDRSMELYKPGVARDSQDTALGLSYANPSIPANIATTIMSRLIELDGKTIAPGGLTSFEQSKLSESIAITSTEDWKLYGVGHTELDDEVAEGAYEFEVELASQPASNVLEFSIQTKGLNFYKQPALTAQEKMDGSRRAENVVGSYAVYHATQQGDFSQVGGNNYRAGKAFHIYRPRIIAADGSWVFGELDVNTSTGILTVTIPESFLANATYPVIVDPTFGYTTAGASNREVGNTTLWGVSGTMPTGTLTQITARFKSDTADAATTSFSIGNDSADPNNLGGDNESATITTSFAWYSSGTISISLSGATFYLAATTDNGGGDPDDKDYIAYDSGTGLNGGGHSGGAWGADTTKNYSVYGTYTESISVKHLAALGVG